MSWYVVAPIVAAVIAGLIALVVEYEFFNGRDGHHDQWVSNPSTSVPGTRIQGEVWVAADGKVHVSGEVQDIKGDSASAGVLVIGPNPADVRATFAVAGAGDTKRINHSTDGQVFDSSTSRIEIRACTQDNSAGAMPHCGPPQVIYDEDDYQTREP